MIKKNLNISFVVILDNIRSTYNVGAIFRTADAIGVSKIYLVGITPAPPNPKINKTALGAENFVVYEKVSQIRRLIKKLKEAGYQIMALEQSQNSLNLFQLQKLFSKKIALILGPEVDGLSKRILNQVDSCVEIPMFGHKESLNVSVAFGIAGYYLKNLLY
ncbi:MAG: TrmH family RNA methyltransferase [Minisyncoccia bacterium]